MDGEPIPETEQRVQADGGKAQSGYDEEALDRFAAAGAIAWADVPDAAQWVRELRGWKD
jgi:hypothetical protein